ncbi:hypothetical protein BB559_005178 [Furculomyces boomerangus]|uniref:Calnexin n=2 Tax=Harpellales TaxID=61421 RepID=A0A2T9YA97_9FUNG|nr:hypothetical protein BB559_007505 [Furculomyces boomerangus]PVU89237.1 hypothetical protein BB559_005178 [Furculomyces boomerangus]PVZ98965.1 hypothetical protein BB558_005019 [Smittium angustum]
MKFNTKFLLLSAIFAFKLVASEELQDNLEENIKNDEPSSQKVLYDDIKQEDVLEAAKKIKLEDFTKLKVEDAIFWEQFTDETIPRWVTSKVKKIGDFGEEDFQYSGEWAFEEPQVYKGVNGDKGLVAKSPARHHAIAAKFESPFNPKGKTLVIQYEVKFQEAIECAGAYIKLLRGPTEYKDNNGPENDETIKNMDEFSNKTPFTIMFGPDKCGEGKVHFIFNQYNPITRKYEEKQLKNPPAPITDNISHLYTLIVDIDNSYKILIDNRVVSSGDLLTDFDPPVNPPREIPDANDTKPVDWVDEPKIVDISAVKPSDWDEDAPKMIEDVFRMKPDDWLDNEPFKIPDPSAKKPEDWDDEMDGDWEPPMIDNPKCIKASGCGPYKPPMIPNPNYKGKWSPPLIDNPDYKGVWEPRKIPNPDFFEVEFPCDFTPLAGVGIEIWTMNSGILFDNIYIGTSEEESSRIAIESWAPKFDKETEIHATIRFKETDKIAMEEFNKVPSVFDIRGRILYYYYLYNGNLHEMIKMTKGEGFIKAVTSHPYVTGVTIALLIYVSYLVNYFGSLIFSPQETPVAPATNAPSKKSAVKKESGSKMELAEKEK